MGVTVRMPKAAIRRPRRTGGGHTPAGKRVVAVILGDGTVREVGRGVASRPDTPAWSAGSIVGPDWTLWWERRSWRR